MLISISNQHIPMDMIVKMSENTVYNKNKSEPSSSQSNPSYIRADDIHINEEISDKTKEGMHLTFLKKFRGFLFFSFLIIIGMDKSSNSLCNDQTDEYVYC